MFNFPGWVTAWLIFYVASIIGSWFLSYKVLFKYDKEEEI